MNHLDYYTVMESRIKYFSQKYDPQNKLATIAKPTLGIKQIITHTPVIKLPVRKKFLERLDSVIAIFL